MHKSKIVAASKNVAEALSSFGDKKSRRMAFKIVPVKKIPTKEKAYNFDITKLFWKGIIPRTVSKNILSLSRYKFRSPSDELFMII